MSGRIRLSILSNVVGQTWSALLAVAFVPVYLQLLGAEAYGLIGFFLTLQGLIQVLDLGLSATLSRELAQSTDRSASVEEAHDLVRTLESGYWGLGLVLGFGLFLAAPAISSQWLTVSALPVPMVTQALQLMSLVTILQWPLTFYQSGLQGLQRQVLLNSVNIVLATLRHFGAAWLLSSGSATVMVFFAWLACVSLLQVLVTRLCVWRSLPPARRSARLVPALVRRVGRFAIGLSAITVTGQILTQFDKFLLSRLLPLNEFGYYVLATTLSAGLSMMVVLPVYNALFPRFSSLAVAGNQSALTTLYRSGAQGLMVLLAPPTLLVALFAREVLGLWTGDLLLAQQVAPVLGWLLVGTVLNGLMHLPYALQLAYGWTRLGFGLNLGLLALMTPTLILLTAQLGAVGGAATWALLNGLYLLVGLPLTHRRLLPNVLGVWLRSDVGRPLAVAVLIASLGRWLLPLPVTLPALIFLGLATFLGAALATPMLRAWTAEQWRALVPRRA